jgi:hypothetical protein
MTAASTTRSAQHRLEELVLNATVPVKDFLFFNGATANPADFDPVDTASAVVTAAFTATGVAAGDVIIGYGVASGLAAGQLVLGAYVSGTDTITVTFAGAEDAAVTTTAPTMNFIVADVT